MLGKIIAASTVIATAFLCALLYATTPATIGPLGILMVFILLYVSVLGVLTFLLFGTSKLFKKSLSLMGVVKRPINSLTLQRSYYFSSVVSLAPVMIIGLQSVGEPGVYDVLLVVFFTIIACVYISKRSR